MSAVIEVEGLRKAFAGRPAVDGLDLEVEPGSVLGMLGPNGAGKTTTVRMLATLTRPDGGTARIAGYDVVRHAHRVRARIGLTGQFASVDEGISGVENLYLIARLHGMRRRPARARVAELVERFDLAEQAGRAASTYSGGQRRRLDLAASMVAAPRVLFLDEPTTGLDPRTRSALWDMVRAMTRSGTTVLLTTQYMEEAEALADRVLVMDHGAVIASGTTGELRSRVGTRTVRVTPVDPADAPIVVEALGAMGLAGARSDGGVATAPVTRGDAFTEVVRAVARSGVPVADLEHRTPSLDEAFLALTGRPRRST